MKSPFLQLKQILLQLFSYEKMKQFNHLSCEISVWKNLVHVWHFFEILPESKAALKEIAQFIEKQQENKKEKKNLHEIKSISNKEKMKLIQIKSKL